jgi:plasmid stabilization system protein ParE
MTTRYLDEAAVEYEEAVEFYQNRQVNLGQRFIEAIDLVVADIERHPYRWPIVRGQVRQRQVGSFPYGIIYLIHHEDIIIIAIAHLRRQPLYWIGRIEGSFDS